MVKPGDKERYIESDFKIRSGLCPNDCGLLMENDYGQEWRGRPQAMSILRRLLGLDFPDPAAGQVWRSRHSGRAFRVDSVERSDCGKLWYVTVQHEHGVGRFISIGETLHMFPFQWRRMLREEGRRLMGGATIEASEPWPRTNDVKGRPPWDAQPGCHACGRAVGAPCNEPEGCRNPPAPHGAASSDGAQRLVDACAPYLKEGETPAECIARNRKDAEAVFLYYDDAQRWRKVRDLLGEIETEFVRLEDLPTWIRKVQDSLREARSPWRGLG